MRERRMKYLLIAGIILNLSMCRKIYDPPAIKASNHFLAVDGIINTEAFSSSTITLTRSANLLDSSLDIPELNAQVMILSANNISFPLFDTGSNGIYVSAPLTLDPNQQYHLSVTTSDGNKYLSDPVTPKASPQIDSLTWLLLNNPAAGTQVVNIYINTHDVTNNTRYYRWDYTETWQHQSPMQTFWGLKNSLVYPIDPSESTFNCWSTDNSSSIILGSSIALSSDVISHALIASFTKNDPKMDVDYSILVRQYPLDFNSYKYWLTIQKNSQSLGGLFDIQPSQIKGNINCITNPNNPALGYVSASTIKEQRLFISNQSLPGWNSNPPLNCPIKDIATNPINPFIWNYPDTAYQLWYFVSNLPPPPIMRITYKDCLDCRFQGGTNIQPPFWQ
ncbi:MAG TPA: DUF4249 domain-containing protein [Puia sp.]|nr:DUF4249 domain-containing protein [Puia sp.]